MHKDLKWCNAPVFTYPLWLIDQISTRRIPYPHQILWVISHSEEPFRLPSGKWLRVARYESFIRCWKSPIFQYPTIEQWVFSNNNPNKQENRMSPPLIFLQSVSKVFFCPPSGKGNFNGKLKIFQVRTFMDKQ